MSRAVRHAPWAASRVDLARAWLAELPPATAALIVTASHEAGAALLRGDVAARGPGAARFGVAQTSLGRLATTLALPRLAAAGRAPSSALARVALCARVIHDLAHSGDLGRFARVADRPGLPAAVASTVHELRLAGLAPAAVAPIAPELGRLFAAYVAALATAGLADRADVLAAATAAIRDGHAHPWLARPTLLLDVPVTCALEERLVAALADRAPSTLALSPTGDVASRAHLDAALGVLGDAITSGPIAAPPDRTPASLARLQGALFDERDAAAGALDPGAITLLSAPGESRECVEIARRVRAEAARGVPFDRVAVLLRSPGAYRDHLAEALRRADIPFWLAPGSRAPDPAGRALLALLACAAEGLTSRRFAEYLSLGEAPTPATDGRADAGRSDGAWVPPSDEASPQTLARLADERPDLDPLGLPVGDPQAAVVDGRLRVPRRWEQLLDDAAVIGGLDRWRERLDAFERELRLDLAALEDPDGPRGHGLVEDLGLIDGLRAFALPLLEALDGLPAEADWTTWLARLRDLATRALRAPERVAALLSDLAPMGPVGPIGLDEVRLVLARHLSELRVRPSGRPAGRVWVGAIDDARGREFDLVFVPGLQEKSFPQRLIEDPLLLDRLRGRLRASSGARLELNADRAAAERLALHLAVGAAARHLVLSWSRVDVDKGRPRVPSFYGLELIRAAEGRLPGFDELSARAQRGEARRLGWPAPEDPDQAIDAAEYDLAVLHGLIRGGAAAPAGSAHYLLGASPHLARALRSHARRQWRGWTVADGLAATPDDLPARAALDGHALAARSYSATALQTWADCPYRFLLYAILRLRPRDVPEAVERLDPMQRGSLFHDTQFELLERLRDAGDLPIASDRLDAALAALDEVLAAVAGRYEAELAPAIDRVWRDGVDAIRADLRGWLKRVAADPSWTPHRFELAFGLPGRRAKDPASTDAPVQLECGIRLRGAIDLVERARDGRLRATDHKTGRPRASHGAVIGGGAILQPVLYALALERLEPGATVESGRLWHCTERSDYADRVIPLDARARGAADRFARALDDALQRGFFPAHPRPSERGYDEGACTYCDYVSVCGPHELQRTRKKPKKDIASLLAIREEP